MIKDKLRKHHNNINVVQIAKQKQHVDRLGESFSLGLGEVEVLFTLEMFAVVKSQNSNY